MSDFAALCATVRQRLVEERTGSHWTGELAASALSTAVAVVALHRAGNLSDQQLVQDGLAWLVANQNEDGSWGDTIISHGNISTTVLAWAACGYAGRLNAEVRAAETGPGTLLLPHRSSISRWLIEGWRDQL